MLNVLARLVAQGYGRNRGHFFFVVVERDVFVLGGVSGQQILNDEFFDSLTSVVTTGADTNLLLEFMNISFMNQLVA